MYKRHILVVWFSPSCEVFTSLLVSYVSCFFAATNQFPSQIFQVRLLPTVSQREECRAQGCVIV